MLCVLKLQNDWYMHTQKFFGKSNMFTQNPIHTSTCTCTGTHTLAHAHAHEHQHAQRDWHTEDSQQLQWHIPSCPLDHIKLLFYRFASCTTWWFLPSYFITRSVVGVGAIIICMIDHVIICRTKYGSKSIKEGNVKMWCLKAMDLITYFSKIQLILLLSRIKKKPKNFVHTSIK